VGDAEEMDGSDPVLQATPQGMWFNVAEFVVEQTTKVFHALLFSPTPNSNGTNARPLTKTSRFTLLSQNEQIFFFIEYARELRVFILR
jgi:hypothetical protein